MDVIVKSRLIRSHVTTMYFKMHIMCLIYNAHTVNIVLS